jgi:DNA-binding sugar fermentation-stimulating protein
MAHTMATVNVRQLKMLLSTLPSPLVEVTVVKRPSSVIKSPYVADVRFPDGTVGLCHTPGLGCCGLVEAGRRISVGRRAIGASAKTACTAYLAHCEDAEGAFLTGIHPMISQGAARGLLPLLDPTATWESEVRIDEHTRIDFVGTRPDGRKVYVEVKNAMISLELTKPRAERKAVFPEGFRKKKDEPVSPRAVKHAQLLATLAADPLTAGAYLLYTVPRTDCGEGMTINEKDPIYYKAVLGAIRAGVQVRAFALDHSLDGSIKLHKEVLFYIDLSIPTDRTLKIADGL